MHIILVKKKQSVKQRNRPISGPIRSDLVIRPDQVNTRTQEKPLKRRRKLGLDLGKMAKHKFSGLYQLVSAYKNLS